MHVLVAEDDPTIAEFVARVFQEQGHRVAKARTMAEAFGRVQASAHDPFDVVILDVVLPDGSGLFFSRELRAANNHVPIVMLTARDAIDDRVAGLEAGADDYLIKPFAMRELLARVDTVVRRSQRHRPAVVTVADLRIELAAHRVRRGGKDIELTAKEFALLEVLALHVDEVVTRTAITAHVWDDNHDPLANVVEVLMRRIRRKIDDGFEPKLIHTLRGAGYRLGP